MAESAAILCLAACACDVMHEAGMYSSCVFYVTSQHLSFSALYW